MRGFRAGSEITKSSDTASGDTASGGPVGWSGAASEGGEQRRARRLPDRRRERRWVPLTAGWLCLLIGIYNVLGVLSPQFHERLHRIGRVMPGGLTNAARAADVITGLMLIMLAHALRRRKRRAWQAVVILLAVNIVTHVVHGPHVGQAVVAAAMLCALLYFREDFYAVGDPRTRWRALWVFSGLIVADAAIAFGYIRLSRVSDDYSLAHQARDVIFELAGVTSPIRFLSEGRTDTFHLMTSGLGLFTLIATAYLFLRPAEPVARLSPGDDEGIRELLATYGERDSLGYFALRRDKSVIWSPSGKSCIGYRVVSGVMLASGDPIGDPEAWPGDHAERGFTMALGRIGEAGDVYCVIATATENGELRAMLHFVPWGADGLSLDLMRRDKQSQPGLNDFLIVETIRAAPKLGVRRISLNFAVFRAALERGERIGAGPVVRAWRGILVFLSKWFQIESLYKFNAKFRPIWEPRFCVFPGHRDAPRVAIAALEAEAFLIWPQLTPRALAHNLGWVRRVRRACTARTRQA